MRPAAASGTPHPKSRAKAVSRDGLFATDRDRLLLALLTRYRCATYRHLATYTASSETALRQRMPRLVKAGLVERHKMLVSAPGIWTVTAEGVALIGSPLSAPGRPALSTVEHTLALLDIGMRFEALGEVVVTEREIRAADQRGRTRATALLPLQYAVAVPSAGQDLHLPDLVLARWSASGTPEHIAVEAERHLKPGREAYKTILDAYRAAPHITYIVYFVASTAVGAAVLRAAKDLGMEEQVEVRTMLDVAAR